MSSSVVVKHNFETAHRLPFLKGKCENLHGHSWWVEVTVTTPKEQSVVVEFGEFKARLRAWIDTNLDHGVMLGEEDPLADLLPAYGKCFIFDGSPSPDVDGWSPTAALRWPTVENVAQMLGSVASRLLSVIPRGPNAYVSRVVVSETHVNQAVWEPTFIGPNDLIGPS